MILVIDNLDSFVFNLARYCECLGHTVCVVRNNQVTVEQIRSMKPNAVVLSPGPCTPNEAGISLEVVRQCGATTPILGVCLGHQTIAQTYGVSIVRSPEPMHGRTTWIRHSDQSVFEGLPNPLQVCRYHSLVADRNDWPSELEILAETDQNIVMAFQHRQHPLLGLQFHPESILTDHGFDLLERFFSRYNVQPEAPRRESTDSLWSRELACDSAPTVRSQSEATSHTPHHRSDRSPKVPLPHLVTSPDKEGFES